MIKETADPIEKLATAILETLQSPNERDSNPEAANVVDGLFAIARALERNVEGLKRNAEAKRGSGQRSRRRGSDEPKTENHTIVVNTNLDSPDGTVRPKRFEGVALPKR